MTEGLLVPVTNCKSHIKLRGALSQNGRMKMNRAFLLFVSIVLAGCGGYGTSTTPPTGATMQAGQWEFVATPTSGAKPVYLETDLVLSPGQVTSAHLQTSLFQFGGPIGGQFFYFAGYEANAS